ncbi:hypothetical protein Tco_1370856 [Tanacetum coccineum]
MKNLSRRSCTRLSYWAHHLENKVTLDQKHQLFLLDLKPGSVPEIFSYPDNFLQNDLFFLDIEAFTFSFMYLSSRAVPRRFPVLSNSARNLFWLQSFTKAINEIKLEILTVVSEVGDTRQDCDTIHQVSISMLLSRHFDSDLGVDSLSSSFQPLSGR